MIKTIKTMSKQEKERYTVPRKVQDVIPVRRCIGTPTSRIVVRNLLPYLVSVIMLRMALTIPAAIGSEVFITYIGLGLSVEVPSLGNLINDGRKVMMQAGLRYQLLYPTIILSFVTIAFYLIGNAFSDAADPKNHLQ